jgi:hypothetical protein
LWLKGTVMEVIVNHPEGSRQATTMIKAKFVVGNGERVKVIGLTQTKKDNPNPSTEEAAASSPENLEQNHNGPPPHPPNTLPADVEPTMHPQVTGAVQTQALALTASTGHSTVPVTTCHGIDWCESNTDLPNEWSLHSQAMELC